MDEPLVAIRDYYKAFSTLDLDACAPFFTRPCLFIGDQGAFPASNREELARVLGPIIDALKTKDYQRSEFVEPQLTTVAENTTLVRGVAARYRKSGTELERVPISYLMHRVGNAWNIAVVVSTAVRSQS